MFFRCLSMLVAAVPLCAAPDSLRVCADPNNMPFSNQQGDGFENKIAAVLARDLGVKLEFVWWSGRRGLVRHTLDDDRCDVLMGIPAGVDSAALTRPYYRSTYVFVSQRDRGLRVVSLNDARLHDLRIGVQMAGEDFTPPAAALARRGLSGNVVGYSLFGEYGELNPASRLIAAVASGAVDLAIAWGPLAGYFAHRSAVPLIVTAVSPQTDSAMPFVYEMSAGVQKGNHALLARLNASLTRNCPAIQSILREFQVPDASGGEGSNPCNDSRSPAASLR